MKNKEWFVPLTKEEFLTSIEGRCNTYFFTYNQQVIGLLVLTCDIPEILKSYKLPQGNYMLIDSIMVKDEYRGQGLQRKILQFAQKQAEKLKMNGLVATVHPDNIYSLNNFVHEDYKVINRLNIHGGQREILLKEI